MDKVNLNSQRMYAFAYIQTDAASTGEISLLEILSANNMTDETINGKETAYEYHYAMQDSIDEIMDLKVGERLQMNFDRHDTDSAGHLKRIR